MNKQILFGQKVKLGLPGQLVKHKYKELTGLQRIKRLDRSKELIRLLDGGMLPNIVLDEKTFFIEQY